MKDNEIIQLYKTGRYLVKDIAMLAGRDQRTISKVLKKHGIHVKMGPVGGRNKIDIDLNTLQELLDQKLTYDEIAKRLIVPEVP